MRRTASSRVRSPESSRAPVFADGAGGHAGVGAAAGLLHGAGLEDALANGRRGFRFGFAAQLLSITSHRRTSAVPQPKFSPGTRQGITVPIFGNRPLAVAARTQALRP
jgi:hypothetical protein